MKDSMSSCTNKVDSQLSHLQYIFAFVLLYDENNISQARWCKPMCVGRHFVRGRYFEGQKALSIRERVIQPL